jgi:hypothetical protein
MAQPEQEPVHYGPSSSVFGLAEMILSDCGCSSDYQPLLNRVAERIMGYIDTPPAAPVAWGVFDGPNLHDMFFAEEDAKDMARLKGDGSVVRPLTTPPAAQPEQKQDSTCNKTLRAEGKGYPRTCMKCGKGPCIADRVQPEQGQWDAIPDAFNEWWDADYDDTGNPYRKDSPAYWAWSGWKAASKQPDAYGYAKRLALAIWEQHYKAAAPQWKPLDDLIGVLTQIDNMTAGLTSHRQPLTDEKIWLEYQRFWPFHPAEEQRLAKDIAKFARAIEAAHGIKENT